MVAYEMSLTQPQLLKSGTRLGIPGTLPTRPLVTCSRCTVSCRAQAGDVGLDSLLSTTPSRRRLMAAFGAVTSVTTWQLLPGTGEHSAVQVPAI